MLQSIIDWLVYGAFGLNPASKAGQSVDFFLYDSVKILLLLLIMIFIVGFLRTYISEHKIKGWLINKKRGEGHIFASLFGAITPFCSCSSVPVFLGFLQAGVPLGVTFSFLVTSPLINEYLVVLMLGFFGWKITAMYVTSGLVIGIISGLVISRMKLERYLIKDIMPEKTSTIRDNPPQTIRARAIFGLNESTSIIKKVWLWVLVGVGIGALIHNYIPESLIQSAISKGGIFTVPIAVLLGVPMYGSCAAIVPIAVALFDKGIPLGTALAFMMATSALSLPEAIILRRAMRLELIAIFFTIVAVSIIFTGYLFNFLEVLVT